MDLEIERSPKEKDCGFRPHRETILLECLQETLAAMERLKTQYANIEEPFHSLLQEGYELYYKIVNDKD